MLLGIPSNVKIYFATQLVDLRKGITGLCAVVEQTLQSDPNTGQLFVFIGKSKNKIKILFWDNNGFAIYHKCLERGRFQIPVINEKRDKVEIEATQLAMLLDGIDLNAERLRRWQPSVKKEK